MSSRTGPLRQPPEGTGRHRHRPPARLSAALRLGVKGLVCDLSGVGFLDASGVRELLSAGRRAVAARTWFDVVCPQPLPRKVIALTGLDTLFALHDTVAGAVGSRDRRAGRPGIGTPTE